MHCGLHRAHLAQVVRDEWVGDRDERSSGAAAAPRTGARWGQLALACMQARNMLTRPTPYSLRSCAGAGRGCRRAQCQGEWQSGAAAWWVPRPFVHVVQLYAGACNIGCASACMPIVFCGAHAAGLQPGAAFLHTAAAPAASADRPPHRAPRRPPPRPSLPAGRGAAAARERAVHCKGPHGGHEALRRRAGAGVCVWGGEGAARQPRPPRPPRPPRRPRGQRVGRGARARPRRPAGAAAALAAARTGGDALG